MKRLRSKYRWLNVLCACCIASLGCAPTQPFFLHEDGHLEHFLNESTEVSYPDLNQEVLPDAGQALPPLTIENSGTFERYKMTLEDAISTALGNAHVLRTLGARVATPVGQSAGSPPQNLTLNPDFAPTAYDVAIQQTGNTGEAQALAAFDAQVQSRLTWDRTDRPVNIDPAFANQSVFFTDHTLRDNMNYQTEVSKRSATGGQYLFRNITQYDSNNNPSRIHPSDWLTSFEMEWRQPLFRNAGAQVNRVPVLLARMNTDIAISDFEINTRNFVYEVEQAYWELYFHYHNLDAARTGYDAAHAIWKQAKTRRDANLEGGEAANEAQSRVQYWAFKSRLEQALSDLYSSEARLRYLLGISPTDGRLIQPIDQPTKARVEFDWAAVRSEAMVRSPELRRQRWRIKQQQLQLVSARNQLLPQFDVTALYRFLGIGDDLGRLGSRSGRNLVEPDSYATDELFGGDYGEWQVGFQYQMPIGFRAEMAQVRSQQLQLRRAEERLKDEELEIAHQLSAAIRRMRDRYQIAQTQFNALKAARDQVSAAETGYRIAGNVPLDVVLDAQSRQAQSETDFFRALTEYNLAIAEVHYRKGSLLEYNSVLLAEGPWPNKAYFDAQKRARERDGGYYLNYGFTRPAVVSRGSVDRQPQFSETTKGIVRSSVVSAPDAPTHPVWDGFEIPGAESEASGVPNIEPTMAVPTEAPSEASSSDTIYGSLGGL